MLADRKLLSVPLLYLSGYIEQHKEQYYDLLMNVSTKSQWVEWIKFFLSAVIHQARYSIDLIEKLNALRDEYREKTNVKRISGTVIKIVDMLFESPIITRRRVADEFGVSELAARNGINKLVDLGILKDVGIIKTKKVYIAEEIYRMINF